jgi:predicted XRE-type DNA-binding protein
LIRVVKSDYTSGMKEEAMELVHGSGNAFRDLGHEDADVLQMKAILAAEIVKVLDREGLTVRGAHARTGIAAADFSRIRTVDLGRFTVDRLMTILNRLGARVEVKIKVRRSRAAAGATHTAQDDEAVMNRTPGKRAEAIKRLRRLRTPLPKGFSFDRVSAQVRNDGLSKSR